MPQSQTTDQSQHRKEETQNADSQQQENCKVKHMGESFQDYSWIQDFEADFPQKVSLKMLN